MKNKQIQSGKNQKINGQDITPKEEIPFTDEKLFTGFIQKLGKDTLSYLPAVIIPAGLSLISVMIFTRIFRPNAYGQYALVIATTGILTALLSAWIQQSVLRYLPKYRVEKRLPELFNNLTTIILIILIAISLLFTLFYFF
ncbi:MAG: oligosaccharide flippase family protein, partial [Nitrospiraceae bacterium]|nr:oligosaccharide flippase family protein [Nitrospiraceae bacterium]